MTTTPPTDHQLADRIADALRAAAYDCDGTCGLGEHECDAQHPIQVAVLHRDVVATVYGDIADLAAVAAAVVQPELDRLAAELEQARQQTAANDRAIGLLLHYAAEAHRRKWAYDNGGEGRSSDAFTALHQLGNEIKASLDKLTAPAVLPGA